MLSVVKILLKQEVGGCVLNSHGITSLIMEKSWNCVFEFLWEPCFYEQKNSIIMQHFANIIAIYIV